MLSAGVLPAVEQLFRQIPVASPAHVAAADLLVSIRREHIPFICLLLCCGLLVEILTMSLEGPACVVDACLLTPLAFLICVVREAAVKICTHCKVWNARCGPRTRSNDCLV